MNKSDRKKRFQKRCVEYGFEKINDYTYYIEENRTLDCWRIVIVADRDYKTVDVFLLEFANRYDTYFTTTWIDDADIVLGCQLSETLKCCNTRLKVREDK